MHTDVLIVGAGPTGLALALTLRQAGVDCVVLDRLGEGQNTSRAAVIHAHTLEVLAELGLADSLQAEGLWLTHFALRDRDRALLELDFAGLPSRYPGLLMLPQNDTERILSAALEQAGGSVQRGWNVESVRESGERVEVVARSDDSVREFSARHVVGADGMHSLVRQTAEIGFDGKSYPQSFVLADVEMDWSHGRDEVKLFFSPEGLVVVAPLPGGSFRVVATLDEAPESPGLADVQALLDSRGPREAPAQVRKVLWGSRFRLQHRVASAYRRGRLLLVGDAAHVHSPAGGQGMNTGLVDAWVLGRLLVEVVADGRDPARLDRYQELRRPAAQEVMSMVGRLTDMAVLKGKPQRLVRNLVLGLLGSLPPVRRGLAMGLSGLSRRGASRVAPGSQPPREAGRRPASSAGRASCPAHP